MFHAAPALRRAFAPGTIDQDSLHRLGSRAEKVGAIGEVPAPVHADQLKPGIVNESGGLKRLTGLFAREALLRHPVQLRVNQAEKLLLRSDHAKLRGFKHFCDVAHDTIRTFRCRTEAVSLRFI